MVNHKKCATCDGTGKLPKKRFLISNPPPTVVYTPGTICPTCKGKKVMP